MSTWLKSFSQTIHRAAIDNVGCDQRRLLVSLAAALPLIATVSCGSGPAMPSFVVTGQNGDAVYTDGERSGDFDLEANSYAVRWTTAKVKPCSASLILHNAQSEKQTPIEFELTPTSSSNGAFNLILGPNALDAMGKYYLSAQVARDCGDGEWKVILTPSTNSGSTTNVVVLPPSQSAFASAYHRVIDPEINAILAEAHTFKGCTDTAAGCVIAFYGALGPQADKTLKEVGPLDVPRCLDAANVELVAALNAFSQASRAILLAFNDSAALQAGVKLYGDGVQHFNTARSLLAQASCS